MYKYIIRNNKTNKIKAIFFDYNIAVAEMLKNKDKAGVWIEKIEFETNNGCLYL